MAELITIFKQLANDEQVLFFFIFLLKNLKFLFKKDAVRVICLDNLKSIIECLNKEENKTHIIQSTPSI